MQTHPGCFTPSRQKSPSRQIMPSTRCFAARSTCRLRRPPPFFESRAFQTVSARLNGHRVELTPVNRWNQVHTADVAAIMRAGPNEFVIDVENDVGPPALWLRLDGPAWSLATDDRWLASLDGAVECEAQSAADVVPIRPGNAVYGGPQPLASMRDRWPTLVLFGLLTATILLTVHLANRAPSGSALQRWAVSPLSAGLLVAMGLWVLLFVHNTFQAPLYASGFDVARTLKYVEYVQKNRTIPLAEEGWEMHHPPLLYVLSALGLSACRMSPADRGALDIFRIFGLGLGLAQLALTAGCLRLLFPAQLRRQLAGLALAAFVPAEIYVCHYITNESLLITLGTAAIYFEPSGPARRPAGVDVARGLRRVPGGSPSDQGYRRRPGWFRVPGAGREIGDSTPVDAATWSSAPGYPCC